MNSAMPLRQNRWWTRVLPVWLLTAACTNGFAADINLVGIFPGKALVSVNGGPPKTISTGQKAAEGFTLISTTGDSAVVEIDGKRRTLRIGQPFQTSGSGAGQDTITLSPDSRGHYITVGTVNGKAVKFLVDTGATSVAMGTVLAAQLGINYSSGRPITVSTAGGNQPAHVVTLASVRVGGITIDNIEAAITPGMNTVDSVLLGMSFIGQLSMQRDGQSLRLSRREGATASTAASASNSINAAANAGGAAAKDTRDQITLKETRNGMFAVSVKINGAALPFLVDTGATSVSMDAAQAQGIGLDYRKGTPAWSSTAGGPVRTWIVKLDSVSVGPITLYGIEGAVREGPGTGGVGLLGMSFLNRVEMRREGESLTLIKRF